MKKSLHRKVLRTCGRGNGNDRIFGYGKDDTLFGGAGDGTANSDWLKANESMFRQVA